MEKYGFVYIWRDKKHKRYYIGMHWGHKDDGYICSSRWMRKSYNRRPEDFRRKILEYVYTNRKELYEREKYWLSLIRDTELKLKYYNLSKNTNDTWLNDDNYTLRKEKISKRTKEAMQRPEIRNKYLEGIKNRNLIISEDIIEKRRQSMIKTMAIKYPVDKRRKYTKFGSIEYIENMSNKSKQMWENRTEEEKLEISSKISNSNKGRKNRLGHKNTDDHNRKIRESNLGLKRSDEAKRNMRNSKLGTTQSEETKQKRSAAIKEWWAKRKIS